MTDEIIFDAENVALPELPWKEVAAWLRRIADSHGRRVGELSYIFCDDAKILEINRQYLGHDYYTDIITFDYTRSRFIRGDMYISLETVATNAQLVGAEYVTELLRVIVHGVLHLCGINDKGPGEREIMEHFENEALSYIDF